jgi:hypothetical protein
MPAHLILLGDYETKTINFITRYKTVQQGSYELLEPKRLTQKWNGPHDLRYYDYRFVVTAAATSPEKAAINQF